eukprot:807296-Rhodomonas_salina.1
MVLVHQCIGVSAWDLVRIRVRHVKKHTTGTCGLTLRKRKQETGMTLATRLLHCKCSGGNEQVLAAAAPAKLPAKRWAKQPIQRSVLSPSTMSEPDTAGQEHARFGIGTCCCSSISTIDSGSTRIAITWHPHPSRHSLPSSPLHARTHTHTHAHTRPN